MDSSDWPLKGQSDHADEIDGLQGRCSGVRGGYVVRDSAGTLVGSAGITAATRVAAAVDSTFFSTDGKPAVSGAASLRGLTLTLCTGSSTLTLHRSGAQSDLTSGAASPTPTRTG